MGTYRRPDRLVAALVTLLVLSVVAGCGSATPTRRLEPSDAVQIQAGLTYWSDGKETLQMDACLPSGDDSPRAAMLVVHGGAFTDGTRSSNSMRALCTQVAQLGIAAFSVDYRLAPNYIYPSQVDDLGNAVAWLRQSEQVQRFRLDPTRIGILGSSAGAILAQSVGTRGKGPRDEAKRVSAVVSLSGVSLMTPAGLELGSPSSRATSLILNYLGCESLKESCPQATAASPLAGVDPTDSPMLLVNGSAELVPKEQADAMTAALRKAKVPVKLVVVDGADHGAALLNSDVRRDMRSFLDQYL